MAKKKNGEASADRTYSNCHAARNITHKAVQMGLQLQVKEKGSAITTGPLLFYLLSFLIRSSVSKY